VANLPFTVNLSVPALADVTVHYATSDGTATVADNDYAATSGTLTIPAGNSNGIINVPIVGDTKAEADETFTLTLTNPTGATFGSAAITAVAVTGTINSDDLPTISVGQCDPGRAVQRHDAGGFRHYPQRPHRGASHRTTMPPPMAPRPWPRMTTLPTSGTLTIPAGATVASVHVTVVGDTIPEGNTTFTLTLSQPQGAVLGTATATATITDTPIPLRPQIQLYYVPATGHSRRC